MILDGKKISGEIAVELKDWRAKLTKSPKLAILQVADLEESNRYIKHKKNYAEKVGAEVMHLKFSPDITETELISEVQKLNKDADTNGIIVQLPLPEHLNKNNVIDAIDPKKDVDGQVSLNQKALLENIEGIIPATTRGILLLLNKYNVEVEGKKVVVVGRSSLVGKPTALALLNNNATVTVCHSKTENIKEEIKAADIVVSATGVQNLITEEMVCDRQIIIDVGINLIKKNGETRLVGDVDFDNVKDKVKYITPVPGGVGPMTVAGLFLNLFEASN